MPIHVVRLGSPRLEGEGLRIGTVRRPPRGVPKVELAARNFYDVWLPDLAPSEELLKLGRAVDEEKRWRTFARKYRAEMNRTEKRRLLDLLAAISRQTNFSVGCYCVDESKCHRSLLRELLTERGALFAQPVGSSGTASFDEGKKMNHQQIITHLRVNGDVFKYLFKNLADEQARWKPGADRWSLLEVINHLYDEEREDFRKRLALVLSDPDAPWPAIDPEGWVLQRGYNERKLNESLDNFFRERSTSLTWLRELASPDWQAIHHHPKMGPMSAELLLANWHAHDLFHIRQVNDLHFAYLTQLVAPVSLGYSGWE